MWRRQFKMTACFEDDLTVGIADAEACQSVNYVQNTNPGVNTFRTAGICSYVKEQKGILGTLSDDMTS